ncbi:MAG: hypothetical protein H6700_12355 [Myxococcales bacterium]|nr:hypothetical protein [Myxococcales bacterium]
MRELDVLSGVTCASFGFTGGELTCSSECLFDLSQCSAVRLTDCGNARRDDVMRFRTARDPAERF